jgi:exodeoxyribonuclease I
MSFVFYDTETSGTSTDFDQILQFAAVKTDADLNEVGRIELRCRLHPHVIPAPGAMRVTGMTIDRLTDPSLPCHYQMVRDLRERLTSWSPAVFIGYNSVRFDEELLRKALFRTLHPPYLTNTGGNCRADALALVQAASVFVPNCLKVPLDERGKPVFKLDRMAPGNGFAHDNAHDALADVLATIHLAKCVRDNAPEVWSRFLRFATKASVASFLEDEDAVVLTEFYFNRPYHFVVSPVGAEPGNPAVTLALDLSNDPDWLIRLPDDQLATLAGRSPKPIRRIRTNAAPCLAALDEVPEHMLGGLDLATVERRAARIRDDEQLRSRLITAAAEAIPDYEDSEHVEEQLYSGGFVSAEDQQLMERFHLVDWAERPTLVETMQDERLRYHGRRLVYELHPELLSPEHREEIELGMWTRLMTAQGKKAKWNSLPDAIAETEAMIAACTDGERVMLQGLHVHLRERLEQGRLRLASS